MSFERMDHVLTERLEALARAGTRKGAEAVTVGIVPAKGERGPRVRIEGEGERLFLRMNSNGYLGLASHPEVVAAEERAARAFGAGPQAVRFISGTFAPHVALEQRLARFHGREAAMIYSSAYAAVMGVLPPLVDEQTAVISDELNHNCIINATRLARPRRKEVYSHLDLAALERCLDAAAADCRRAIVVTDGVFSMRGDHAPLDRLADLADVFDARFAEGVVLLVDDSHGVGAFGATGRGTEEVTRARADVLIATLGKALGVNGGYVVGSSTLVDYLRETSPFYVYSNPITPGEAAAAERAVELLDSDTGRERLAHLRAVTARFRTGLAKLGYESVPGEHPVVPVVVRDTPRTRALVEHLRRAGVLATGLAHPVVPRGEEEIRFQLCADHTRADVDAALAALASFPGDRA
ncbi:MAG: pyridoxal phosphate-dependent aminotransferase family protein [Candidatus Krumholzibacteria bacterium]|nr:pyridoxal phosphate-dependent aminotransferase family protein [Candidatus Krumholzibacteria bacterium]